MLSDDDKVLSHISPRGERALQGGHFILRPGGKVEAVAGPGEAAVQQVVGQRAAPSHDTRTQEFMQRLLGSGAAEQHPRTSNQPEPVAVLPASVGYRPNPADPTTGVVSERPPTVVQAAADVLIRRPRERFRAMPIRVRSRSSR